MEGAGGAWYKRNAQAPGSRKYLYCACHLLLLPRASIYSYERARARSALSLRQAAAGRRISHLTSHIAHDRRALSSVLCPDAVRRDLQSSATRLKVRPNTWCKCSALALLSNTVRYVPTCCVSRSARQHDSQPLDGALGRCTAPVTLSSAFSWVLLRQPCIINHQQRSCVSINTQNGQRRSGSSFLLVVSHCSIPISR